MTIQLPEDVKPIDPTATTDGIQLPFTAPLFWWNNGEKKLAQVGGVSHFGGWQGSDDLVEAAMAEYGALPDGFSLEARTGNDGEYAVYAARAMTVVPIKTRKRWKDNRTHSQTLCLLAKKENGLFSEWGPIVLSAKGYATDRLSKAIRSWVMHTREARERIAPNVPAWYFWAAFGTFGEYVEEVVGQSKKSPITPINAFLPQNMTDELLIKLYVGNDTARRISELEKQAKEWAEDEKWLTGNEKLITVAEREQSVDATFPYLDEEPF